MLKGKVEVCFISMKGGSQFPSVVKSNRPPLLPCVVTQQLTAAAADAMSRAEVRSSF